MDKCRYIDKDNNCTRTECGGKCEDISDCYYKQLQQANENIEKLKHIINTLDDQSRRIGVINNYMGEDIKYWVNLKEENERIKEELNELTKLYGENLKDRFDLKFSNAILIAMAHKIRKSTTDIKTKVIINDTLILVGEELK